MKFKFHACCHGTHSVIESLIYLIDNYQLKDNLINRIEIFINPQYLKICNIEKPKNLKEMVYVAKQLSKGISFVRVDLYSIPEVKFGEITFYPGGGIKIFQPTEWNKKIGDLIEI